MKNSDDRSSNFVRFLKKRLLRMESLLQLLREKRQKFDPLRQVRVFRFKAFVERNWQQLTQMNVPVSEALRRRMAAVYHMTVTLAQECVHSVFSWTYDESRPLSLN